MSKLGKEGGLILLAILLTSCKPSEAQILALRMDLTPAPPPSLFFSQPPRGASVSSSATVRNREVWASPARRPYWLPSAVYQDGPDVESRLLVGTSRTSYEEETHMPFMQFLGGHLEVNGFTETQYVEPHFFAESFSSIRPQSHDQEGLSRSADYCGLSVRINFARSPEKSGPVWRRLR
jgi:hypothetical protein